MTSLPPRQILLITTLLSLGVWLLQLAAFQADFDVNERGLGIWSFAYWILLAMWVEADSRTHASVYRPYEFGWLVFIGTPFYLIYYLYKTRGALGLLWLLFFIVLIAGGSLLQWASLLLV